MIGVKTVPVFTKFTVPTNHHIYVFDDGTVIEEYEVNVIILALVDYRNKLIYEGKYTDMADELLMMLCK